jgi:hypothetical protein
MILNREVKKAGCGHRDNAVPNGQSTGHMVSPSR